MRITKCDICGKSNQDEKTYIGQYRRAIFLDGCYSIGDVIAYDYIDICEECKEKLQRKSMGIFVGPRGKKTVDDYVYDGIQKVKDVVKDNEK